MQLNCSVKNKTTVGTTMEYSTSEFSAYPFWQFGLSKFYKTNLLTTPK